MRPSAMVEPAPIVRVSAIYVSVMAVPFQVPAVTVPRPVIPVYEPVRRPVGRVPALRLPALRKQVLSRVSRVSASRLASDEVETVSAPPTTLRPVPVKSVMESAPRVRRVTVVEDMVVEARVVLPETVTLPEKVAAAPAKVPETVGEAIVGEVPNTTAPDPVSPVTAAAKLAVEGVARKVATPVPSPEIPVETGRPVALVRVAADGVQRFGVVKTGETAKTAAPVPVSSVRMVASSPEVSISAVVIEPEAHDCHSKFEVPDS